MAHSVFHHGFSVGIGALGRAVPLDQQSVRHQGRPEDDSTTSTAGHIWILLRGFINSSDTILTHGREGGKKTNKKKQ